MFKLTEQNIVVLGSLNPSILQPKWLSQNDIIPKGEDIKATFSLDDTELPTKYEWPGNYTWHINRHSLRVNVPPENSPANLSKFISKVFNKLEHTPVNALGQNFVFEGEQDEISVPFCGRDDLVLNSRDDWGIVQNLKHEITFQRNENSKMTVYMTRRPEKSVIQVNFHYEVIHTTKVVEFSNEIEKNSHFANEILKEVTTRCHQR